MTFIRAKLEFIKDNLLAMYENSISAGTRLVAATVLPYNTASESEAKAIRDLNSWIESTAKRLGALFCDTNRAVADAKNHDRLRSSADGYHPDVSGYRSMGEALAIVIETDHRGKWVL